MKFRKKSIGVRFSGHRIPRINKAKEPNHRQKRTKLNYDIQPRKKQNLIHEYHLRFDYSFFRRIRTFLVGTSR